MRIQYDSESDTLTVRLAARRREAREARAGDVHAGPDGDGALTRITVERLLRESPSRLCVSLWS